MSNDDPHCGQPAHVFLEHKAPPKIDNIHQWCFYQLLSNDNTNILYIVHRVDAIRRAMESVASLSVDSMLTIDTRKHTITAVNGSRIMFIPEASAVHTQVLRGLRFSTAVVPYDIDSNRRGAYVYGFIKHAVSLYDKWFIAMYFADGMFYIIDSKGASMLRGA